jgi:uncharacterized membrane protein
MMSWHTRYRASMYLRYSMWIVPALGILAGWGALAFSTRIDRAMGWQMNIGVDTARLVIGTVTGSMFSLVVIVSSALMVAVQLAAAQLTPRLIGLIYKNRVRKIALAVFTFSFTFSLSLMVRLENTVPLFSGYIAAYSFLLNLILFIYFIDSMGKSLRPSAIVQNVARLGHEAIASVYPLPLDENDAAQVAPALLHPGAGTTVHTEVGGVVIAFDREGLIATARRSHCLIELAPEIGDFVAAGDPLFRIYEDDGEVSHDALRDSVAFGLERILEDDPVFAFRIIVDIAAKALSPAINDPTTAVIGIDQLHQLLRDVGGRQLANGMETDANGRVLLVYPTPNWEDFVSIAVTEIRQYGATSIQVTRRLRAMLENLIETLPELRRPALQEELELLGGTIERAFIDPEERDRAGIGDLQGVGGRAPVRAKVKQFALKT